MFGTNPLRRAENKENGTKLTVQKVFHTIQGEGPFAGEPAVFVRLWGCNLRCFFCDTDFESHPKEWDVMELVDEIERVQMDRYNTKLVVITGGEPMRQNIGLLSSLLAPKYKVQIETAGTLWVQGLENLPNVTIVCSPKTAVVHRMVEANCRHWKYLMDGTKLHDYKDGLPMTSTQEEDRPMKLFRPGPLAPAHTIWLQPMEAYDVTKIGEAPKSEAEMSDQQVTTSAVDERLTSGNLSFTAYTAMKHGYRVSIQMHKILGVP